MPFALWRESPCIQGSLMLSEPSNLVLMGYCQGSFSRAFQGHFKNHWYGNKGTKVLLLPYTTWTGLWYSSHSIDVIRGQSCRWYKGSPVTANGWYYQRDWALKNWMHFCDNNHSHFISLSISLGNPFAFVYIDMTEYPACWMLFQDCSIPFTATGVQTIFFRLDALVWLVRLELSKAVLVV